jgi:hypothetical protein
MHTRDDLRDLTVRQLLARRRAAARLSDVDQVLTGTLTELGRLPARRQRRVAKSPKPPKPPTG